MSTNTIPSIPTIPRPPIPRGRAESPDSPERYARPDIREIPHTMRREWTKLRAKVRGTKMLTYSRKNARKVVDGRKEPAYYAGLRNNKQDSARYAERMDQTPRKGARHKDAKQAAVTNRGR